MKNYQALEMPELVQEIEMLIDDWHFVKCPHHKRYYENLKSIRAKGILLQCNAQ